MHWFALFLPLSLRPLRSVLFDISCSVSVDLLWPSLCSFNSLLFCGHWFMDRRIMNLICLPSNACLGVLSENHCCRLKHFRAWKMTLRFSSLTSDRSFRHNTHFPTNTSAERWMSPQHTDSLAKMLDLQLSGQPLITNQMASSYHTLGLKLMDVTLLSIWSGSHHLSGQIRWINLHSANSK